jgi:hypothetical protein
MSYLFTSNHPNTRIEGRRFERGIYRTEDLEDALGLRKSPFFGKTFHEVVTLTPEISPSSPAEAPNDPGKTRRGRKPARPSSR